jgi:plastocyanin
MRQRLLPTVAVPALLLLAACGSSSGDSSTTAAPTAPGPQPDLVIRALDGIRYDAKDYTVAAGGDVVVRFENDSSLLHDVYFKDANGVEQPTFLQANGQKTDEKTVHLVAGTYQIYCRVPGHGNMKATVTVG